MPAYVINPINISSKTNKNLTSSSSSDSNLQSQPQPLQVQPQSQSQQQQTFANMRTNIITKNIPICPSLTCLSNYIY